MEIAQVKFNGNTVVNRYIVRSRKDLITYKAMFPSNYNIVKNEFIKEIEAGRPIIVHDNGSWCGEAEGHVEIVHEKTKVDLLIDKYTEALNTRKHNMAETGESMNDTERYHEELAIRRDAEIIRDLKTLQISK
jgi:hypothetical protein